MRRGWWLCALAGCSFQTTLPSTAGGAATDASADDAPPDAKIVPFCDPADPSLIACYEFEGSTRDASTHALDATMTNVSFVPGRVGLAMQFGATSAAEIADSPAIDADAITVEAWVKPSELPGVGQRAGIADMNGQWGLFIHEPTGRLQCTMGLAQQIDAGITIDTWTHVACTYANGTLTIYVNGVNKFQATGGPALSTAGTTGISLCADNPPGSGQRMIGLMDEARIMSRARTDAEICEDAASCP